MLERRIHEAMQATDKKWNIAGKGHVEPDEIDILAALDKAAEILANEPLGTRLEVGGLIIDKGVGYFDVYVHVGTYV